MPPKTIKSPSKKLTLPRKTRPIPKKIGNLDMLPDDMIYEICKNMDQKTLRNTIATSKRLRKICGSLITTDGDRIPHGSLVNNKDWDFWHNLFIDLIIFAKKGPLQKGWKEPKICFGGIDDSNQTKYEYNSNQLNIGVIANNKEMANFLLFALRIVYDNNKKLLSFIFDDDALSEDEIQESYSYMDLIKIYGKHESYFASYWNIGDEFSVKLGMDTIIKKRIHDVDIWTASRIMDMAHQLDWE